MIYGIEQGDLAKWLRVVVANDLPGAERREIPPRFVEFLLNLRCIQIDAEGIAHITEKGKLSLRMEAPSALHRFDEPNA